MQQDRERLGLKGRVLCVPKGQMRVLTHRAGFCKS